jgi:hypothetical protein
MLSPKVQFLDVNPWHWRRLCDAVFGSRPERGLTLLVQAGRIVKAHDSAHGLRPEWKAMDGHDAEALAQHLYEAEQPDWVQVLDVDALHDYGMAVQVMHDWHEDADAYLARCFRTRNHFPGRLVRCPPWPTEMLVAGVRHSTLSQLVAAVPDGHTLTLAVFEGEAFWTSAIARIQGGKIVLITSTDAFLPEDASWPGWRETYDAFLARVGVAVGPVDRALLATRDAFLACIRADDKRIALAQSIAQGEAIVCPGIAAGDSFA